MQLPLAKARGRGAELCAQAGGRTSIDFSARKWGNNRHSKTPQGAAVETGRMRGKGGCRRVMGADRPAYGDRSGKTATPQCGDTATPASRGTCRPNAAA